MAVHPNSLKNLRPFKKGETGNPGGRPKEALDSFHGAFVHDMRKFFDKHKDELIMQGAEQSPLGMLKLMRDLFPKEFVHEVGKTSALDDMTYDELEQLKSDLAANVELYREHQQGAGEEESQGIH